MNTPGRSLPWPAMGAVLAAVTVAVSSLAGEAWDGTLVQYGSMREAIGEHRSQGRVLLSEIAAQPHFYGVAALEDLEGDVTFFDSIPTITGVTGKGALEPLDGKQLEATMLAGARVRAWSDHPVDADTPPEKFDRLVSDVATRAGIDTGIPFVFTVEGEFTRVRLHVLNGACPIHARIQRIEIPAGSRPFEGEYEKIRGRAVGIYAEDAAGRLTHPATSTHVHLIFKDEASGSMVTGHIERIGLEKGAVLRLPNNR